MKMKNKILIGVMLLVGSCSITTFGASAYLLKGCDYDQSTGNYIKDGKEYAFERLKRAVIREYLNNRITFIKKEKEEIDAAKKRLKKTITKLPQKNDK